MWMVFLTHLDRPNLKYLDTIFDTDVASKKAVPRLSLATRFFQVHGSTATHPK